LFTTAATIRQRYWPVSGTHKLDALTRILEAETTDAMLVFVRTKTATLEIAEKLEARGYRAVALNGDIAQKNRERIIIQLKAGKLDILVATDVAARGLDVERISHVINYDIPHDTEAYVHRIGRTGRAGRKGDAILFVAPREQRMLQSIERATRQKIDLMQLPSTDMVNNRRIEKFKQCITDTLADEDLSLFKDLVTQYQQENEADILDIAAALAKQVQGNAPFLLSGKSHEKPARAFEFDDSARDRKPRGGKSAATYEDKRKPRRDAESSYDDKPRPRRNPEEAYDHPLEAGKERFRIEVGHNHKVKPGNIVGAIANEANIDSKHIGRINIFEEYSVIDLPENMPKELLNTLKPVRVAGQRLDIALLDGKKPRDKDAGDKTPRARPKVRHKDKKDKGKPKRIRKS
jgi:ATP-dependent RNA helicase DeaD